MTDSGYNQEGEYSLWMPEEPAEWNAEWDSEDSEDDEDDEAGGGNFTTEAGSRGDWKPSKEERDAHMPSGSGLY